MKIDVFILPGKKLEVKVGEHKIVSDQEVSDGGEGSAPNPFDYFLSSLAMCAAHYIRSFCDKREISTEGIKISQNYSKASDDEVKRKIEFNVSVPESFPDKYRKALLSSIKGCAVKKAIEEGMEFKSVLN